MDHRTRLKDLLLERSVRLGDFTLASGARSSYYVDARRTTMSAEGQVLIGRLGLAAIEDAEFDATHVGGMTMGADPVSYAIAHRSHLDGRPLDAFSVRKKAKEHGTGQRIEGGLPQDARVVLVEDTVTTGGSALEAMDALVAHGVDIVGVLAVVDRGEGGRERIEARGVSLVALFTGDELKDAAAG